VISCNICWQYFLERLQIGIDEAYRVVDFMRDTRSELADRGHLLGLQELVLRGFQLRDELGLGVLFPVQGGNRIVQFVLRDRGIGVIKERAADQRHLAARQSQGQKSDVLAHLGKAAGNRSVVREAKQIRPQVPQGKSVVAKDEDAFQLFLQPRPRQFGKHRKQVLAEHVGARLAAVESHEAVPQRHRAAAIDGEYAHVEALDQRGEQRAGIAGVGSGVQIRVPRQSGQAPAAGR
jgi:hypothetical protein